MYPCSRAAELLCDFPAQKVELNLFAATLNQDDQQNDSNDTGDNPDNRCIVHVSSPFLLAKKLVKRLHHDDGRRTQGYQEDGGKDK